MLAKTFTAAFVFATIFITLLQFSRSATMAPLCQAGIVEEMPTHIKKVCLALENSEQYNSALKSYINNEAALVSNSEDLGANFGKRTDMDHIFLRFGKRR